MRYGQAEVRCELLMEILATMRRRCGWVVDHRVGEHRATGFQQERAAIAAGELMENCGLPLTYSLPSSPYCRVASLFFEAMTGTFEADLERACRKVAQGPIIRTEKH